MGVSTPGDGKGGEQALKEQGKPIGLDAGHAYLILDTIELKDVKLVRIRNPWGHDEGIWLGRFSNQSKELIENLSEINSKINQRWKEEAELFEISKEDGSFFMCLDDFVSIWKTLSISKKFTEEYSGIRFFGEWNERNSGGYPQKSNDSAFQTFLKNPQFIVEVKSPKDTELTVDYSMLLQHRVNTYCE